MRNQADKIIVTNFTSLGEKYGSDVARVKKGLTSLVEADAARGLKTVIVPIDQRLSMARLGAKAVTSLKSERQAKKAIDLACRALRPDYVMIVGAGDVVPFQSLSNPVYDPEADVDRVVPSDLPYACEGGHETSVGAYLGPSRVVGRVPDVVGGRDSTSLLALLTIACEHRAAVPEAVTPHFAVTADAWRTSTELSLEALFGGTAGLQVSPPDGEGGEWPDELLARRAHFINCHGAPADSRYYGQHGSQFPVAHMAQRLAGRITPGTVVAAECCYGADLYDPRLAGGEPSIAETYLREGAAGFFGSTTIAYGPPDRNDGADLICRFFLQQALSGASLGRAALEARLQLLNHGTPLDPYNAKTLAQFCLLGDPSVHLGAIKSSPTQSGAHRAKFLPYVGSAGYQRSRRRERLFQLGRVASYLSAAPERTDTKPPTRLRSALFEAATVVGRPRPRLTSFIAFARTFAPQGKIVYESLRMPKVRFFCAVTGLETTPPGRPRPLRVVVATEIDGAYEMHTLLSR